MSIYTNTGLVTHVKKALELKTKYMWAGTLNPITDAYITQKVDQCIKAGVPPSRSGYTDARIKELRKLANRGYYGVDCVNLIKSYPWSGKANGGTGSPKYDSSIDMNANVMYSRAPVKGTINTMPDIPGLIVYSKSHPHVGVYIGGGETIESTLGSRGDGVVKRKLDSFWEYWFKCPFIEYKDIPVNMVGQLSRVTFAYKAKVRARPRKDSACLGEYLPGQTATIVIGSGTKDPVTGYEYVRVAGDTERWVVRSAIR